MREEQGEEDWSHPRAAKVVRAEDNTIVFITVVGQHCTASDYTATTHLSTAILSPSIATVSPPPCLAQPSTPWDVRPEPLLAHGHAHTHA